MFAAAAAAAAVVVRYIQVAESLHVFKNLLWQSFFWGGGTVNQPGPGKRS
jgi:hypothetical protein